MSAFLSLLNLVIKVGLDAVELVFQSPESSQQ